MYDSTSNKAGFINPMRYRGYYLDGETGFFYVGSRYYDPGTCRFLNADEPSMLQITVIGLFGATSQVIGSNLFAYCNNNPVMNIDSTGYGTVSITFKKSTICWAIAAVAGALTKWAITSLLSSAAVAVATAISHSCCNRYSKELS